MVYTKLDQVNKDVKIDANGIMHFGTKLIEPFCIEKFDPNHLECWYTVRVEGRLVTTLDLSKGMFWVCGFDLLPNVKLSLPNSYYDKWSSVEYLFNHLCYETNGKEWTVSVDESFEDNTSQDWWSDEPQCLSCNEPRSLCCCGNYAPSK